MLLERASPFLFVWIFSFVNHLYASNTTQTTPPILVNHTTVVPGTAISTPSYYSILVAKITALEGRYQTIINEMQYIMVNKYHIAQINKVLQSIMQNQTQIQIIRNQIMETPIPSFSCTLAECKETNITIVDLGIHLESIQNRLLGYTNALEKRVNILETKYIRTMIKIPTSTTQAVPNSLDPIPAAQKQTVAEPEPSTIQTFSAVIGSVAGSISVVIVVIAVVSCIKNQLRKYRSLPPIYEASLKQALELSSSETPFIFPLAPSILPCCIDTAKTVVNKLLKDRNTLWLYAMYDKFPLETLHSCERERSSVAGNGAINISGSRDETRRYIPLATFVDKAAFDMLVTAFRITNVAIRSTNTIQFYLSMYSATRAHPFMAAYKSVWANEPSKEVVRTLKVDMIWSYLLGMEVMMNSQLHGKRSVPSVRDCVKFLPLDDFSHPELLHDNISGTRLLGLILAHDKVNIEAVTPAPSFICQNPEYCLESIYCGISKDSQQHHTECQCSNCFKMGYNARTLLSTSSNTAKLASLERLNAGMRDVDEYAKKGADTVQDETDDKVAALLDRNYESEFITITDENAGIRRRVWDNTHNGNRFLSLDYNDDDVCSDDEVLHFTGSWKLANTILTTVGVQPGSAGINDKSAAKRAITTAIRMYQQDETPRRTYRNANEETNAISKMALKAERRLQKGKKSKTVSKFGAAFDGELVNMVN